MRNGLCRFAPEAFINLTSSRKKIPSWKPRVISLVRSRRLVQLWFSLTNPVHPRDTLDQAPRKSSSQRPHLIEHSRPLIREPCSSPLPLAAGSVSTLHMGPWISTNSTNSSIKGDGCTGAYPLQHRTDPRRCCIARFGLSQQPKI